MPTVAGTVGILSSDLSRYSWFAQSLMAMRVPPNTKYLWIMGLWVSAAVNALVQQMEGEFLIVLSDDHILPSNLLLKLLAHNVPLVAPSVCLRRPPFQPSFFHETDDGTYTGYTWDELDGQTGLLPVDTFGGPGCVIRREVIEAVGMPFFESDPRQRELPHEDLYSFSKCRKAGFQPYVDLDTQLGHILPAAAFPTRTADNTHCVRLWAGEDLALFHGQRKADDAQ